VKNQQFRATVARRTYLETTLADMMQRLVDAGHGERRVSCQTPSNVVPWWGWEDFASVQQALVYHQSPL
jgi:hypothetical protein